MIDDVRLLASLAAADKNKNEVCYD